MSLDCPCNHLESIELPNQSFTGTNCRLMGKGLYFLSVYEDGVTMEPMAKLSLSTSGPLPGNWNFIRDGGPCTCDVTRLAHILDSAIIIHLLFEM